MSEFIERYRYWIGSILLVLILAGGGFLLWRDGKWKPALEERLEAMESQFDELKTTKVASVEPVSSSGVNPAELIQKIETKSAPAPASSKKATSPQSGKVAGATTKSDPVTTTTSLAPSQPTEPAPAPPSENKAATSGKPPLPATPININTASAYELTALPGIGTVTAQYIVDYRTAHGSFKSISELDNVKNFGEATINKIRDHVAVN